jgi:mono/diheme cytochrome c family protein
MGHSRNRAVVFLVLAAAVASPAAAQDPIINVVGEEAYQTACAVCHGSTAQGDGEFADVLKVRPPDLTTLRARNDGVFPYMDIFRTVDGRETVRAHGTPVMPIWGDYFIRQIGDVPGPFSRELLARTRITALVDYLETLQR